MTKHRSIKNVLMLAGSALSGQAVVILTAPLLTRLYGPEPFGLTGVIVSLAGLIAPISSLRYNMAIVVPEKDVDAEKLLVLSTYIIVAFAVAGAAFLGATYHWIPERLNHDQAHYLFFAPVFVLLAGLYDTLIYWSTRQQTYKRSAASRVIRSAGAASLQLAFSHLPGGLAGLTFGRALGDLAAVALLVSDRFKETLSALARYSVAELRATAKTYRRFVEMNTPATLLNAAASSLPPLLMAAYFGPVSAGLYWMTFRLLEMPVATVSQSVSQVFLQRASALKNAGHAFRLPMFKTALGLAALSMPCAAILFAFGPPLFASFLGEEWREAGEFARWLAPLYALRVTKAPFAIAATVIDRQHYALILEAAFIGPSLAAFPLMAAFGAAEDAVMLYAAFGMAMNLILIALIALATLRAPAVSGAESPARR